MRAYTKFGTKPSRPGKRRANVRGDDDISPVVDPNDRFDRSDNLDEEGNRIPDPYQGADLLAEPFHRSFASVVTWAGTQPDPLAKPPVAATNGTGFKLSGASPADQWVLTNIRYLIPFGEEADQTPLTAALVGTTHSWTNEDGAFSPETEPFELTGIKCVATVAEPGPFMAGGTTTMTPLTDKCTTPNLPGLCWRPNAEAAYRISGTLNATASFTVPSLLNMPLFYLGLLVTKRGEIETTSYTAAENANFEINRTPTFPNESPPYTLVLASTLPGAPSAPAADAEGDPAVLRAVTTAVLGWNRIIRAETNLEYTPFVGMAGGNWVDYNGSPWYQQKSMTLGTLIGTTGWLGFRIASPGVTFTVERID